MNRRIIKSILNKKFNNYVASIKDEELRKEVRKNTIITGGALTSLLLKEKVNDYDIYFTNFDTTLKVAKYYVDEFNRLHRENSPITTSSPTVYTEDEGNNKRVRISIQSAGIIGEKTDESQYQYFENRPIEQGEEYILQTIESADDLDGTKLDDDKKEKYRPVFLSDNAITLANDVQLIIRFYGNPEEIHSNYDFIHCTNYWTPTDNKLVLQPYAIESILSKELFYSGSKYPVCSFIRTRKFIKQGWHINAGQMLKICLQISELDLKDLKVLEDQLTGVDTAYFIQLINALKSKRDSDPDFQVNMPYIASIVDKIF